MGDLHYFPFMAGDWLASEAVTMMTPEQEGAFIRLLSYAWQSSGVPCSLPNDDDTLAHLSRLGKRWAKVGAFVKAQFEEVPDDPTRLRNPKLWAVFCDSMEKHSKRVKAGKAGGVAKAMAQQSSSNATAMPEQSPSNQNQNQSQNQREEQQRGADAPSRPPRVLPAPWVAEGVAWWQPNVGRMVPSRFQAALRPMVDAHNWAAVFPDLRSWVAARKAAGKPAKLEWYAEESSARLTRITPPIVDEWGCLTEYGERITRPAGVGAP